MSIDGTTHTYTYAADGTKLKVKQGNLERKYAGNFIYEGSSLKRILIEGGYIEDNTYYFYFNDHLGNVRAVTDVSGNAVQRNHYYPFGLPMAESTDANQNEQPYKYNGKEFERKDGLNWMDYGARHYDAALGRFTTIDPLSEKYYAVSPYAYCANNPIRFIDPKGKEIQDHRGNGWDPSLKKQERLTTLVNATNSARKSIFKGSGISLSGSVRSLKGKATIGPVKGGVEVGIGNIRPKQMGIMLALHSLLRKQKQLSLSNQTL